MTMNSIHVAVASCAATITLAVGAIAYDATTPGLEGHANLQANLSEVGLSGYLSASYPLVAPCASSMTVAHAEDDVCAMWLVGPDQHVVAGPLSAAPYNATVVGQRYNATIVGGA